MASTIFEDRVTHIEAEWANDVNRVVYDILGNPSTKQQARVALGIDTENFVITGGSIDNTPIGQITPAAATFTVAKSTQNPLEPQDLTTKDYVDSVVEAIIESSAQPVLIEEITLKGTDLGALSEGDVLPLGTTFTEVVKILSTKEIPPTYTTPSVSMPGSPTPALVEVGTLINLTLNPTFSQADGGPQNSAELSVNGGTFIARTFPYVQGSTQYTEVDKTFVSRFGYDAGPVKNNNLGVPDATGQIPSGQALSNTLVYKGYRRAFYGMPASVPNTSVSVRALANSFLNPIENAGVDATGQDLVENPAESFSILVPAGASRVTFAYPASLRDVAAVRYVEMGDINIRENFTKTSVNVEGLNNYTSVAYKVYTFTPDDTFSQDVHYKVFI